MTISTGTRAKVGYISEVTYGTTPATPDLTEVPFTSFAVNLTRNDYEDTSIRSDRMERYSITGNRSVGGQLSVNFSHSVYDFLLESLMQNAFATNVLKTGTTRKSFTMEEGQADVAQYRVYTGVIVDKLDLTVPAAGIVTAKFDLLAKDQSALTGATIDTNSAYTAAATKTPFANTGTSGFIKEGGSTVGYVTSIQLNIDNGHAANFALGATTIRDFTTALCKVTGTVQVFFEDSTMYNKFANGTASSLDFKLDDGTNTVEFNIPNVKYTGATKTINGSGPVVLSLPFRGLYDNTTGSNIVITRT